MELFNHQLAKMQESGYLDKLKGKWVSKAEERRFGFGEAITLGYENVLFPFGIVAIAALAGVMIAAVELVHKSIGKI